jgi:hypothetical protein
MIVPIIAFQEIQQVEINCIGVQGLLKYRKFQLKKLQPKKITH